MKLILSRKGFDSQYGGIPSPILPDGRLVPLPIPSRADRHTFADLNLAGVPVTALLTDLSGGAHDVGSTIHLDPDLDRSSSSRLPGWRPAFGQSGAAQTHLANKCVGVDDVFLFFGWFRGVENANGKWRYVRDAPHLHVLFGWLEIAEVLPLVVERQESLKKHPWIADHPHVANSVNYNHRLNHLYVGAAKSRFARKAGFGGGRFRTYADSLRLTKVGESRSVWSLPKWIMPSQARIPLSYHPLGFRWKAYDDHVQLVSAAKGQEFVLDGAFYPDMEPWLRTLIEAHA